jgi:hypothetical protein
MKRSSLLAALGLLSMWLLAAPAAGQGTRPAAPTDAEVELIPLRSVSTVEVARVLDEAFNGSGNSRKVRVVVVAVPLTNWLLVRASVADLRTVRDLVQPL